MAAAYSMDLRTRVLKDSDAGLASKELAERYHVSRAWVDALKQRRRETGAIAALKHDRRAYGCDIYKRYIDIAQERVASLQSGTLRLRPMNRPVYEPPPRDTQ